MRGRLDLDKITSLLSGQLTNMSSTFNSHLTKYLSENMEQGKKTSEMIRDKLSRALDEIR